MHIDDSACNLASINLMEFLDEDGTFLDCGNALAVTVDNVALSVNRVGADASTGTTSSTDANQSDIRTLGGNGAIVLRSTAGGLTITPASGYVMSSTEVENGGNATLDMNAGATVYGSVVVQGQIDKANGTAAIVYNADVLINLTNDPASQRFSGVPGGWSDERVSY